MLHSFDATVIGVSTLVSGIGVALMGVLPVGVLDSKIKADLSHGNTQMVMAVFIILLVLSVCTLFFMLTKQQQQAHKERDAREDRYNKLFNKLELSLQNNTRVLEGNISASSAMTTVLNDMRIVNKDCQSNAATLKAVTDTHKK